MNVKILYRGTGARDVFTRAEIERWRSSLHVARRPLHRPKLLRGWTLPMTRPLSDATPAAPTTVAAAIAGTPQSIA